MGCHYFGIPNPTRARRYSFVLYIDFIFFNLSVSRSRDRLQSRCPARVVARAPGRLKNTHKRAWARRHHVQTERNRERERPYNPGLPTLPKKTLPKTAAATDSSRRRRRCLCGARRGADRGGPGGSGGGVGHHRDRLGRHLLVRVERHPLPLPAASRLGRRRPVIRLVVAGLWQPGVVGGEG